MRVDVGAQQVLTVTSLGVSSDPDIKESQPPQSPAGRRKMITKGKNKGGAPVKRQNVPSFSSGAKISWADY